MAAPVPQCTILGWLSLYNHEQPARPLGAAAGTVVVYAEGEAMPKRDLQPGEFPDECLSRVLVGVGPRVDENY